MADDQRSGNVASSEYPVLLVRRDYRAMSSCVGPVADVLIPTEAHDVRRSMRSRRRLRVRSARGNPVEESWRGRERAGGGTPAFVARGVEHVELDRADVGAVGSDQQVGE